MADNRELASFPKLVHRIGAFLLDTLLVAALLALVSVILPHPVRAMGPWARYVGGLVTVTYFTLGNSGVFHGQTLGKRFFALRLRNIDGGDVSLGKSLLRASVLIFPFVLNGATIPDSLSRSTIAGVAVFPIILGIPLSTAYLMLFVRPTRRGVQDLVAGTVVALADVPNERVPSLKKLHLGVVGLIMLAAGVTPSLVAHSISPQVQDLKPLVVNLSAIPTVWSPKVSRSRFTMRKMGEGPRTTRSLVITAGCSGDHTNFNTLALTMARTAFAYRNALADTENLIIRVNYGVDLFMFRWGRWEHRSETVETWRSELGI